MGYRSGHRPFAHVQNGLNVVDKFAESVSAERMTRKQEQTLRVRQKLLERLPLTGEILRGSLLERTVFRTKPIARSARRAKVTRLRFSPSLIPVVARANSACTASRSQRCGGGWRTTRTSRRRSRRSASSTTVWYAGMRLPQRAGRKRHDRSAARTALFR